MAAEKLSIIQKWWEKYEKDALDSLDKLLCGIEFMGELERNDTDEILFRIFHKKSEKVRHRLDDVMREWFGNYWGKIPGAMPVGRWSRILKDAFIAVYRLDLGQTYFFLRDIYTEDKSWLRSITMEPPWNPEEELLRTLALAQKDQFLLPLWMRLCRMEEDLPIDYASIGLMGLRKLPEEDGSQNKDLPAAFFKGAICLAEALGEHNKKEYMDFWLREMRAVVARYPRSKEYWARYFYPFLYGRDIDRLTGWLDKVIPKLSTHFNAKAGASAYIQPPSQEKRNYFVNLIIENKPLETFRSDLEIFLEDHRRYAYQTGDSFFLVRTFSNIGYKLLRQDSTLALKLMQEAFGWEPYNPFLWSQLAIIEISRGNETRAAALLWEAIRRFPENAEVRNNLAHLLAKQGKWNVAETIYRQAMEDFPGDVVCRAGLADVLKAQDKLDAAEIMYRQTMEDFPDNEVCRNGLAEVLLAQNRLPEAEQLYRQDMKDFPKDVVFRNGLAEVLMAQNRLEEAEQLYRQTMKDFPGNVVCRNGLAEVLGAQNRLEEAEQLYRQTMKDFPNNVVCRNGLAVVLLKNHKREEGIALLKETVEMFPGNKVATELLERITGGKEISETDELMPGNQKPYIAPFHDDEFDFPAPLQTTEFHDLPRTEHVTVMEKAFERNKVTFKPVQPAASHDLPAKKHVPVMEKAFERSGASLVRSNEPIKYGKQPSPAVPAPSRTESGSLAPEIGKILVDLRGSRYVQAKEKENYYRQVSIDLERLLEKAPNNLVALLAKGLWLIDQAPDDAQPFLSKLSQAHPNIIGFRLLELRSQGMTEQPAAPSQWNDLIHDFPNRSTVIKLEQTLAALHHTNGKDRGAMENLENLRLRFSKDPKHLPPTLQKNEEWVRTAAEYRLFKDIDTHDSIPPKALETFKENYENSNSILRETVNQCLYATI